MAFLLRVVVTLVALAAAHATSLAEPSAVADTPGSGADPVAGAQVPHETVSFRSDDGATIVADVYGCGTEAVVLAHGGRFNKESWKPQAESIARAGFRVLALDFRGYGRSKGPGQEDVFTAPLHLDVLAAVRYLRESGAANVAVIGASLGGWAAANAVASKPGAIDRLVLLGADAGRTPDKLTVPKLFIVTRDDRSGSGPRLPGIRATYERTPQPKRLVIHEGSAHAQYMFQTELADRVLQEILRFLSAPR
jgi:pimeloyl-ACP methyl ester carboxylesterase